jgi:hypothetical protein
MTNFSQVFHYFFQGKEGAVIESPKNIKLSSVPIHSKIWAQSDNFEESFKQISIFITFWGPLFQPALEPHRGVSGGRFLRRIF